MEGGEDVERDIGKRHDLAQHSYFRTGARHSVDDAGGFILAERESALAGDGLHSKGTVVAHAGHDDPHGGGTKNFSDGRHHDIRRRDVGKVAGQEREVQNSLGGRAAGNGEVLAGRSKVDVAGGDEVAFFGFAHCQRAEIVEALGKGSGESDRHVLHDEDSGGEVGRKGREDVLQGFGAASGSADGDDRRHGHGGGWSTVEGREIEAAGEARSRHAGTGGSLDLADEFVLDFEDVEVIVAELLGDAVEGAEFERFEGIFGTAAGERAYDDDWERRFGHDALEGFQAGQAGHIDVEGNDVGLECVNFCERFESGFRGADDAKGVVGFDHAGKGGAHEGAVVHDQDFRRRMGTGEDHEAPERATRFICRGMFFIPIAQTRSRSSPTPPAKKRSRESGKRVHSSVNIGRWEVAFSGVRS